MSELDALEVPVLVVQGGERSLRDALRRARAARVIEVPGNHSLRDGDAVSAAISDWLPGVLSAL